MPTPQLIFLGLILPAVISGLITLFGSYISRGSPWPAIAGLYIGLFVGYRGIAGEWPPLPAVESPERIVWFTAAFGVVAILAALKTVPWPVRTIVAIAAPAVVVWFVFRPLPAVSMPPDQMWRWIAIVTAIAAIVMASTEGIAMKRPGVAAALSLGPVAAGLAVVLLLIGTARLGWMSAATGLMILGWFVASLVNKSITLSRGPVYVAVTLIASMLTYDYFDSSSITATEVALLCVGPVLAWFVEIPAMAKWKPWKRELLRLILVTIPVAVAVILAVVQLRKDSPNGLEM